MIRTSSLCSATFAAVLALIVPAWAAAAPRTAVLPQSASVLQAGNLVPWIWGQILAFLTQSGCTIDPNGQPELREAVIPDEGCTIDPSGRCQPAPALTATDSGCTIDPSGCR